jgi:amino acid adenylation domain-containing protein
MSPLGRETGMVSIKAGDLSDESQAAFVPLHGRFFAYCENPDNLMRTAIRWRGNHASYGDLRERVEQIATSLRACGVKTGERVALITGRTFDAVAAVYGILAVGGVIVPVDPQHPAERIRYMCSVSDCRWLVIDYAARLAAVPGLDGTVLNLATLRCTMPGSPLQPISEEDLAYVFFTSGSTGLPKGVMVSHGSTSGLLTWALRRFSPADMAVVLGATSLSFDISIVEFFAPLVRGGCLCLVDSVLALMSPLPPSDLTLISSVPSALSAVVAADAIPPSVRNVLLSGEALHGGLVSSLYRRGVVNVFNLYGPTEATVFCTEHQVSPDCADGWVPIGRPLPGVDVCIVDDRLCPVEDGASGELCVLGGGLARGYIGRADLTAERFVECPAGPHAGRRMYRTGDRVRMRNDGELEYIGRFDDQIKWRGYRIELSEIASVIGTVAGVARASVHIKDLGCDGSSSREVLAAYVLPESSQRLLGRLQVEITERVAAMLPKYMRPQYIIFIDAFPLMVSGKVDAARLPAPRSNTSGEKALCQKKLL